MREEGEVEEEEEEEVGFAFPDVTAQLLLAAAGFQFPPAAGHRARLRAAGALIVSAIRAGWISPPPTATRAGS